MEVRLSTQVLLKGEVVAHSTMNILNIEVPGTHTLDLVRPDEDPDATLTSYQLVIVVEEAAPDEVIPVAVATKDPDPSKLSIK